jgi:hypothetical protein
MAARASIAIIVKNKFMRNSKLAIFYKIVFAVFLMTPLFSCYLFENTNSVASNEDFGHSDNAQDDDNLVDGISAKNASQTSVLFVAGSKDIPLANGLNKISDDGLDFDSASGSIIAVTYKSSDDLQKMKDFYVKTLPQLGWNSLVNDQPSVNLLRFKRDNEKLEIEFLNYNGDDLVKFFVETVSK